ncbi:hypothetical protein B0H10DRAFT_1988088 [Mycena sp. CBHHK59/15]|nr:hypothetical protein B0H10DRAFT_1988088 [Mycena sp. CBHHK59/15]
MATQPMGEVNQQLWDDTFTRLLNLSRATLKRNALIEARVVDLEMQVSMWRRAHEVALEASDRDTKAHQTQISALNNQISKMDIFANQDPLILCVINGDENLFNASLLAQGQQGGITAVKLLTQTIATHLGAEGVQIFGRVSYWITVYFNRGELIDRLTGNNIFRFACSATQSETCIKGFSQSSPRFCFVDVGYGMDGTSLKMREYIQTFARFPQTLRVFLAGGCDPQYSVPFGALQSEQLLGKVVLLTNDGAGDQIRLSFPSLRVEGLFMALRLQQIGQKPPLTVSCVTTNGGLISPQSPAPASGRIIDLSLVQNPPPCNEHYLMSCSKGPAVCKYSHEYILTKEQLACLSSNAKKAPCNWLKNGLQCPYADKCCWGHICPNGPKCFHLSKGKCWFKGETMHPPLVPEASSAST